MLLVTLSQPYKKPSQYIYIYITQYAYITPAYFGAGVLSELANMTIGSYEVTW
jgi:hypothetical protein